MKPIKKIRIWDIKDKKPKLNKPHSPNSDVRYSPELILYWEWVNHTNRVTEVEPPRTGRMVKNRTTNEIWFQIDGISGLTRVLAWGYLKPL